MGEYPGSLQQTTWRANMHGHNTTRTTMSVDELTSDFLHEVLPLTIVTGLVSLVGVAGNIFVLYVHLFRYKRCNFRCFVLGLCVVDLIGCAAALPMNMYAQIFHFEFKSETLCKTAAFVNVCTCVAMTNILFMISVDRFRKICVPHGWQLRRVFVKRGLGVIACISVVQSFPMTIVWGINKQTLTYNSARVDVLYCRSDELLKDTFWPQTYIMCLVPNFLLMAVMLVLYGLVFRKLSRTRSTSVAINHVSRMSDSNTRARVQSASQNGSEPLEVQASNDDIANTRGCKVSGTSWYLPEDEDSDVHADEQSIDSVLDDTSARQKCRRNIKIRRTTVLTFVFTISFICTGVLYMVLGSSITDTRGNTGQTVSLSRTVAFLFAYRLFYVNYVMHPILYGFMDRQFRQSVFAIQQNVSNSIRRRPNSS